MAECFRVGQVAALLRLNVSYVFKTLNRRRLTAETAARPQSCHVPLNLVALHRKIAAEITARHDAALKESRRWLVTTHETTPSKALMVKTVP